MGKRDSLFQVGGSFGDVVAELHKEGHVTSAQFVAASKFLHDWRLGMGSSGGVVSQVAEKVDVSTNTARNGPPAAFETMEHRRAAAVIQRLRPHEKETLHFLVMKREKARGSLSDYGRIRSAYEQQKTAKAVATGIVVALLETIRELYSVGNTEVTNAKAA